MHLKKKKRKKSAVQKLLHMPLEAMYVLPVPVKFVEPL